MLRLDSRYFSQQAYSGLQAAKIDIRSDDFGKASSAAQGLSSYISTWGLHRLSGDYIKYQKRGDSTRYRQHIYGHFLATLRIMSPVAFDPENPSTLVHMESLHDYTGLNRLAIALAQEWSFWAVPILGEPKGE